MKAKKRQNPSRAETREAALADHALAEEALQARSRFLARANRSAVSTPPALSRLLAGAEADRAATPAKSAGDKPGVQRRRRDPGSGRDDD